MNLYLDNYNRKNCAVGYEMVYLCLGDTSTKTIEGRFSATLYHPLGISVVLR